MNEGEFSVTIASDTGAIPGVTAALEKLLKAHAFEEDEILDVQLAVEEAISNIILHGYRGGTGVITVCCKVTGEMAEVRIEDSAPPFDPLSMPEPDLAAGIDGRTVGGMGIPLIRRVMDGITYRYENGKNILVLVRWKAFPISR